jgi:hypothetical protein
MAALTVLMVYEKTGRRGRVVVRPAGALLLAAAGIQLVHPTWLPAALGGPKRFATDIAVGPGPSARAFHAGPYELDLEFGPNEPPDPAGSR